MLTFFKCLSQNNEFQCPSDFLKNMMEFKAGDEAEEDLFFNKNLGI